MVNLPWHRQHQPRLHLYTDPQGHLENRECKDHRNKIPLINISPSIFLQISLLWLNVQSNSMKLTMYVLITKQPNNSHYTEHSQSRGLLLKKLFKKKTNTINRSKQRLKAFPLQECWPPNIRMMSWWSDILQFKL